MPDDAASHPLFHLANEGAWKGTRLALKGERAISFRKSIYKIKSSSVRITEKKKGSLPTRKKKMARVADDSKLGVVSHHKGIQVRRLLDSKIHARHACVCISLSVFNSSGEQLAPS